MAQKAPDREQRETLKQSIFCEQNIKWAGVAEVDIVLEKEADQTWNNYRESGFSDLNYKQYQGDTLLPDSLLMQQMLSSIQQQKTLIYKTDALEQVKTLAKEDWNALSIDEEEVVFRKYTLEDFEVIRLKLFIVYDDNNGFGISPLAVAPIRTDYDIYPTPSAFGYHLLGWIPVHGTVPQQPSWQKIIHSDLQLKNIKIFKQDWEYEEAVADLIQQNQQNNAQHKLYKADDLNVSEVLTPEQLQEIITYEDIQFDPDTFEEFTTRTPYEYFGLVGMNLSLQWTWDEVNQQLHVQAVKFSPIAHKMDILCEDCEGKNMYLYRLFSEKK